MTRMTTKDVKQWLWQARGIEREIQGLYLTRDKEFDRVTATTSKLTGETISGTMDPHKYDRLTELNETIDRLTDELTSKKAEILSSIYCLKDSRFRQVLKLYYVDCMTLEQIAVQMNYSFQHISRLKYEAVIALKDAQQ